MTEFLIKVEDSKIKGKRRVTVILAEGEPLFTANLLVTNEQIHDHLTRFFLNCVRQDINRQEEGADARAKSLLED